MTKELWGQTRKNLLKVVGDNNYQTWIAPLKLVELRNGIAQFEVPTTFIGNWVARNFSEQICQQLECAGAQVSRVEFSVAKAEAKAAIENAEAAVNRAVAPVKVNGTMRNGSDTPGRGGEGVLPGASLDSRFTFDSFVVGKPNELAHAAARRVAEGGAVSFNPLFLYGGVGLGKTHLMHAVAWELQARAPEKRVLYVSAEQFMYRFVQSLREKQVMGFKEIFRSVDVLMVDDVQFIAGKDSTQEEFFHTFNALVDQNKQIIISADRSPGEIANLEERIRSRLQWGLVVDLHPADYELRLGILQQKAAYYAQHYSGVELCDGVLEFLAHRITSNVRVLEGALTRLYAFASLVGREVTLDMVQECLADILRASDRKVTVEEIQRRVADHYNVRLSDLIGPKRVRTIARPRQVAMYLAKHLTSRSLPEIGRRFGGRDHTTIMHGVRRIEELISADQQMAEDLALLRRLLDS
jgi:chromosomal replication initiator protein